MRPTSASPSTTGIRSRPRASISSSARWTGSPGATRSALDEIEARDLDRIPVVDGDALVGLICFNKRHGHFCVDG